MFVCVCVCVCIYIYIYICIYMEELRSVVSQIDSYENNYIQKKTLA
jgi:hypothetical protein